MALNYVIVKAFYPLLLTVRFLLVRHIFSSYNARITSL
nr:MAG TPA: hypothetical protein [Caudoviricetes sp.]